jgi:RNA polymerase sigma-70 factor (ECF subfamily)
MTDEERWVSKALEGDEEAFDRLLRPHRQGMMNLAFRMTGNLDAAEEICQEAMIKVFKYLNRFQTGRSFRNWAFKITANAAYDFLRRQKKEEDVIEGRKHVAVHSIPSPEKRVLNRDIARRLQSCLEYLTPKERMVLLLRDAEGFSVKETAGLMRSSSMAVRTHLSRARSKIRMRYPQVRSKIEGGNER